MESERVRIELLRPAADLLRTALRRMDDEDVPASLRAVATSSARRLPPPLLKRAIDELDRSEWLRAETLAGGELDPDGPSHLFVSRPDGWEESFELLLARAREEEAGRRIEELQGELDSAARRMADLQAQVASSSDAVAEAERTVHDRLMGRVESAERARRRAEMQAKEEAEERASATARAERLEAELESAFARLDGVRQLLERERRRAAEDAGHAPPTRSSFPDDPHEMAAELDRIVAAVRRPPAEPMSPAPATSPDLRLPDGYRPDRPESIRWLMSSARTWLVDGYNVAFKLAPDPDASTRARIVASAGRLVSGAASGTMAVVVFDSAEDVGSIPADRRVRVVFAPSADEWILDHAVPGSVVVSSDRRVREGSESDGAIGIWSEAFATWIARGMPA